MSVPKFASLTSTHVIVQLTNNTQISVNTNNNRNHRFILCCDKNFTTNLSSITWSKNMFRHALL